MLIVTDAAKAHIAEELGEAREDPPPVVRLVEEGEGFALELGTPSENDETHQREGRTVLVLEPHVAEQVDQMVLDTAETDEGTTLELSAPADEDDASSESA
jgi:Fe-S cluster assembly iron-binding protein IscA